MIRISDNSGSPQKIHALVVGNLCTKHSNFLQDSQFVEVSIARNQCDPVRISFLEMQQLSHDIQITAALVPRVSTKHKLCICIAISRTKVNALIVGKEISVFIIITRSGILKAKDLAHLNVTIEVVTIALDIGQVRNDGFGRLARSKASGFSLIRRCTS